MAEATMMAPRSGLLQQATMMGRDLERRLEGSPASLFFPSNILGLAEEFNYGTPSAQTAALAALEAGGGTVLGKVGAKGLQLVRYLDTLQAPDWLKNSVRKLLYEGEDPDEIAQMIQFQMRDRQSKGLLSQPKEETPMGLLPELTDQAKALAGTDEGLKGSAKPSARPTATFITGLPAAGKSSVANPLARELDAAIIDPDEAKKLLPGFDGGIGATAVHEQSKVLAQGMQDDLVADGYNLLIGTVGNSAEKLAAKANALRQQGYEVNLVNMLVDETEGKGRALYRSAATNRHIPLSVIEAYGTRPQENYGLLKELGVFDNYAQIDNSGPIDAAKKVIEDTGGLFSRLDGFD